MTQSEALNVILKKYNEPANVGIDETYPDAPYFVGIRMRAQWSRFGCGKSFEQAIANIRDVEFNRPGQRPICKP